MKLFFVSFSTEKSLNELRIKFTKHLPELMLRFGQNRRHNMKTLTKCARAKIDLNHNNKREECSEGMKLGQAA